jgi:hypothetical protein
MKDRAAIEQTIQEWHGASILDFMNLEQDEKAVPVAKINSIYHAVLAKVERPTGNGYWAQNFVVTKETNLDEITADFSDAKKKTVKEGVSKIFTQNTGTTSISVYAKTDTDIEYFFQ